MAEEAGRALWERLEAHHKAGYLSLHMPGHKENAALAPYLARLGAELDITELPEFDDLHDPSGVLAQGMDRAAKLWGSRKSYFQVNGSTGGLLAAIRAATRRGDQVLVARHCHKAVYHAIELCGLDPVFLLPPVEETFGLAGSLSPEQVAQALEDHPGVKLVVYPSPTYDGVVSDTAGICATAHAKGVPVLVDEAHGAHLGFHPAFPPGAMAQGADLAVASLHKMLPSLTQTALLHAGGKLVPLPQVARQTGIFSPAVPPICSHGLHGRVCPAAGGEGRGPVCRLAPAADGTDQGIQGLRHLRVLGHGREAGAHYPGIFALDPAKILISTQGTGLTGVALRDLLRREYRIEVEMALDHYVLAMTGLGTDDAMPARLAQALLAIDETCASNEETPSVLAVPGALPPPVFLGGGRPSPGGLSFLYDAMGKVCGEYIWAYPPGIPLIAPGRNYPPLVETVEGLYRAGSPDRHPG
ncbi:MAG: aminotransferase class I/II-fold pyridoxal phosphate-dependent enzyme [Evtepia gabavorous]